MCDPVSMAIASVGSTMLGVVGDSMAADAQNDFYRANAENANNSARNQYAATQTRMSQETEAAALEKHSTKLDAEAAIASAETSAGEAGVSGYSVDRLLRDLQGREARYSSAVDTNLDMSLSQLQSSMDGINSTAQNQINSVRSVSRPSFFDVGLRIATAGINGYASGIN